MPSRWQLFQRQYLLNRHTNFRRSHGDQFHKQFRRLSLSVSNIHQSHRVVVSEDESRPDFVTVCHQEPTPFEKCVEWTQLMRYRAGLIVYDKDVQKLLVILIALNAIIMGIDTFDFVRHNPAVAGAFDKIDLAFLIVFTIELGMQFMFYGLNLLWDGWLVFDLVIITMSWAVSQAQIIRAFRIFRAFRLITRVKFMKNVVLAIFSVMPRMFAIEILLTLVSYVYAVACTQLFKDLYERKLTDEDYFGSLDRTFFTLFQIMTMDAWPDVARQVMAVYSWAWVPFVSYVVITGFVFVNLIIAVICDAISALHADDKAKLHGTYEEDGTSSDSRQGDSVAGSRENDQQDSLDSEELQMDVFFHKVDAMEEHIDALGRMQDESFRILAQLTQQLGQCLSVVPNPALSLSHSTVHDRTRSLDMQDVSVSDCER